MFKQPTSRRKSKPQTIAINLVPILDAMVTLIAFMLFSMSFLAVVSIESPFPMSSPAIQQKLKEKPLQLTLSMADDKVEIWSPFDRISTKVIPHTPEGLPNLVVIHETLLGIKQKFPHETNIVVVPLGALNYETLIQVMDSARGIEATDPPIFTANQETGISEPVKALFPNVVFGNLLGDT
ncbi:MAG: biopolymer transporter ExbD [Bdellovibrionota bacterium]